MVSTRATPSLKTNHYSTQPFGFGNLRHSRRLRCKSYNLTLIRYVTPYYCILLRDWKVDSQPVFNCAPKSFQDVNKKIWGKSPRLFKRSNFNCGPQIGWKTLRMRNWFSDISGILGCFVNKIIIVFEICKSITS
jgi:hypothetical protein